MTRTEREPPTIEVPSQPLSEADRRLEATLARLEEESLAALEAHARQVITLCTTLLAAFFGLLSLGDRSAFLDRWWVQWMITATLTAFFLSLVLSLDALLPRPYRLPRADLTAKREALDRILHRKYRAMKWATWAFGAAILLLLTTTLGLVFFGG